MGKHHGSGIVRQRFFYHFTRIDAGLRQRPPEQFLRTQQSMLGIQPKCKKYLMIQPCQMQAQIITHCTGVRKTITLPHRFRQGAPCHFQYSLKLRELRRPHARNSGEFILVRSEQPGQTTEMRNQLASKVYSAFPANSHAPEDGQ